MRNPHTTRKSRASAWLLAIALLLGGTACDDDNGVVVTPGDFEPELDVPVATWVEEGWQGRDPVGQAGVELRWTLPDAWNGEVFRVYSRESGGGDYFLVATVTSCAERQCVYTDINVAPGETYDYFITAVDERSDEEIGESEVRQVMVPNAAQPTEPADVTALTLDHGVFLQWASAGDADHYRVFLEGEGADSVFLEVGSTDGTGYLDSRAENGTQYTYRVAAVSVDDYLSRRSEAVAAIPRPDYHAELIYPTADSALASGFQFTETEDDNPIVAGTSAEAQWRLEASGDDLLIVPLGQTRVTQGIFTTDLSCGPGSEANCEYVAEAPPSSDFGTTSVTVSTGNTYVFEVAVDGQPHFAKIRVIGDGIDNGGNRVVVFDWAYQLVANEPSLNVAPLVQ